MPTGQRLRRDRWRVPRSIRRSDHAFSLRMPHGYGDSRMSEQLLHCRYYVGSILWSRDSYSRLLGSAERLRLGLADLQSELAACAKTKTVEVGKLRGHQKHATY